MSREFLGGETLTFAIGDLTQYAVMPITGAAAMSKITNLLVPLNETFANAVTFEIKVGGNWYPHKDLTNKTADQNKANVYTLEDSIAELRIKMVATVAGTAVVEWWGSRY